MSTQKTTMTSTRRKAATAARRRARGAAVLMAGVLTGLMLVGGQAGAATQPPGQIWGDFGCSDPFIHVDEADEQYYLYCTGGSVRVSSDLREWHDVGNVWGPRPEGAWYTGGSWAPEVHEYDGRYYVIITMHNTSAQTAAAQDPLPEDGYVCSECIFNRNYLRSTVIGVADTPAGPFTPLHPDGASPITTNAMNLDGTLYVEDGVPYLVYAREWIQALDGTVERVRLTEDLRETVGEPLIMMRGSEGSWYNDPEHTSSLKPRVSSQGIRWFDGALQLPPYVTDGAQFWNHSDGSLIMLWTTYRDYRVTYTQTYMVSRSGRLEGPWEQREILTPDHRGHGMIFTTLEGRTMLAIHNNVPFRHGEFYPIEETSDGGIRAGDLWVPED